MRADMHGSAPANSSIAAHPQTQKQKCSSGWFGIEEESLVLQLRRRTDAISLSSFFTAEVATEVMHGLSFRLLWVQNIKKGLP